MLSLATALCRSIGDLDAGPLIVPLPHVRQVLLTRQRALRLIMASDGLWDLVTFRYVK
jgi:serine/threonine protein phosphatase PrpC